MDKLEQILNKTNDFDIIKFNSGIYQITIGWYNSMKTFTGKTVEEAINKTWSYLNDTHS